MTAFDLTPYYRSAIGIDRMASLMDSFFASAPTQQNSWPHYNVTKSGEHDYRITMAVAGFSDDDLDITLQDNTLIISGKISQDDEAHATYLYRGIAGRQFEKKFQLADFIKIKGAQLKDGLLHVDLLREVPEALKPRKIDIVNQNKLVS
ncbi:MAG: Hsp20 family protein [Candidatus Puniceispirillaceae bacterium]